MMTHIHVSYKIVSICGWRTQIHWNRKQLLIAISNTQISSPVITPAENTTIADQRACMWISSTHR